MGKTDIKPETNLVKETGDKTTLELLQAQKKKPVMLPITENMEPELVVINGCIYAIPRGELVEVPESIFDIIQEGQMRNLKAKAQIKTK